MRKLPAVLVAFCLVIPAAHAAPQPPQPAQSAAAWLASRVGPGGYVAGLDGKADPGTTVTIGIALAAAGTAPQTAAAIANYLAQHIDDYARASNADRPGALGRLALLASATGRDPNAFGGTAPVNRLVDRILATQSKAGLSAGMFVDPLYSGMFNHSLGLLGVATARALTADQEAAKSQALDFLVAQQCDDGGWQNGSRLVVAGVALTACAQGSNGPDTNAAGLAVQALAAHHRNPRVDPLIWLDAAQNQAGGYGYLPGGATDADSTALVVQAIVAAGAKPTDARFTAGRTSAYAALLALQIGSGADRGAFAYMRAKDGSLRPNILSTAEAAPAAARQPFPIPSRRPR